MKRLLTLFVLLVSAQAFAYLPTIKNWKADYSLSEKQAAELIYDYYIHYVWWEDEGYECGGNFMDGELTAQEGDSYTISGYVTVAMNYCAYEADAYYEVKIQKVDGKYKVEELAFDVNEEY